MLLSGQISHLIMHIHTAAPASHDNPKLFSQFNRRGQL
ncbi:hypothetical protein AO382_0747 [Moraxella catarrhalis]|uniref:Uncharacterized protein n=1 Tax=Moraxella catarrhalis TaxID=480 RepID=A0A7Z0UZ67_MORCA|nr:hypothetical protein AO382_0747 [Moraxella catarrhalis]